MDHHYFKPNSLEQAKDMAVGSLDQKQLTMQKRWEGETPVQAAAILHHLIPGPYGAKIVDYGCGAGRVAKEVLAQARRKEILPIDIYGVDDSPEMLEQARLYLDHDDCFHPCSPEELPVTGFFDLVYLIYVFQHMPSMGIRDALQRMWTCLKDDGLLFFCGSENRMALPFDDSGGFVDDRVMGIDRDAELSRFFDFVGPAIPEGLMNDTMQRMVSDSWVSPLALWRKKKIEEPLFNVIADKSPIVVKG